MIVMAVDVGYGNVKRATGRPETDPRIDCWPACAMPAADMGMSTTGAQRAPDVTLDGQPWCVGLDPEDAANAPQTQHANYITTPTWRAQLLYALTKDIPIDLREPRRIVLGLPADEWEQVQRRNLLKEIAGGVARDARWDHCEVVVLPQPMGAYIHWNAQCDGALTDRNALVVDVGYTTLDWALFSHGQMLPSGVGTTRLGGVSATCTAVRRHLLKERGSRVSDARVRRALLNRGVMIVDADEEDCSALIKDAASKVATRAMNELQRSLLTQADEGADGINDVILSGGGAQYYRGALKQFQPRAKLHESADPVRDNVRGFWFYGAYRD